MSSLEATRCRHVKVSGTQCGSPALRSKNFCFYHQQHRPLKVECYSEAEYPTGEIVLPVFEDAHSIQSVIRQVVQMVLQKRIERKTATLLLYALQIASSNLKRIELEKPQPEQVVIAVELDTRTELPIAALDETARESSASAQPDANSRPVNPTTETGAYQGTEGKNKNKDDDLPLGTIQACSRRQWVRPERAKQLQRQRTGVSAPHVQTRKCPGFLRIPGTCCLEIVVAT